MNYIKKCHIIAQHVVCINLPYYFNTDTCLKMFLHLNANVDIVEKAC